MRQVLICLVSLKEVSENGVFCAGVIPFSPRRTSPITIMIERHFSFWYRRSLHSPPTSLGRENFRFEKDRPDVPGVNMLHDRAPLPGAKPFCTYRRDV